MARARDPNRDKAYEIFKQHDGKILLKDIAAQTGKSDSQIRKWKNQDNWDEKLKGNVTNENKSNVTNEKNVSNQQRQRNGSGNSNPQNQFTKRNQAAKKHGLFSKYIPQETLELMGMLDDKSPADLIWDQIQIQYAAIIRSQSIMFVTDKDEIIKELSKFKPGQFGDEEQWKFQFAWERQAQFLNAQSRAISELRNSINQFIRLTDEQDERRLKLEYMKATIEKTNAEIDLTKARVRKENGEEIEEFEDDGFIEALNAQVGDVWSDVDDEE